jgi:hypothetical protein
MSEYTKERMKRIISLLQKETPTSETAADSDDDRYHYPF